MMSAKISIEHAAISTLHQNLTCEQTSFSKADDTKRSRVNSAEWQMRCAILHTQLATSR